MSSSDTALIISLGGVVVLVLAFDISNKRYCLNKLKKAGALSPEKAVTPEEAKIERPWSTTTLSTLVKKGKVGTTEDGRFYIHVQNDRPQ